MFTKGKYKNQSIENVLSCDESYCYYVFKSGIEICDKADHEVMQEFFGTRPRYYMPFGKYKGEEVVKITDNKYIRWLVDNEIIKDDNFLKLVDEYKLG